MSSGCAPPHEIACFAAVLGLERNQLVRPAATGSRSACSSHTPFAKSTARHPRPTSLPDAPFRSRGRNPPAARSAPARVGPAPLTTAATPPPATPRPAPPCRASPRPGSPGAAGPRWPRSSSVGPAVSACTSSAARPALNAASACGTVAGSAARAVAVSPVPPERKPSGRTAARGRQPHRPGAARLGPGDGEAAEQAGRHVVGVPLDRGGQPQRRRVVEPARRRRRPGPRASSTPGDDRGRRGAQPAGLRNAVDARHGQPGGRPPSSSKVAQHGPHDQMLSSSGSSPAPSPVTVDPDAVAGDPGASTSS